MSVITTLEALRDQVSMVLQKNVLFSGTIYDNIRWGDETCQSDEEVQSVCKLAQADGFVSEFPDGYNTRSFRAVTTYPAVRNSVCVLQGLFSRNRRS